MRYLSLLLLIPTLAPAGVAYDVSVRPMDQSSIGLSSSTAPPAPPIVTPYFVEAGKVRVGGSRAKTAYIFKDATMYAIDNEAHVVHVLKRATLAQAAAHYTDAVKQLQDAAASASPGDREEALRKAADMQAVSDRILRKVTREYRVTSRFESVDGHACRMWEMQEGDAKRLELCVALVGTVPGGADILNGLKTLSQFRQGSNFAIGVDFGLAAWWPDFNLLGGVPLLIREYKYESQISEVMLSNMRPSVPAGAQFDPPSDYQSQEGPDYVQWFVR